MSGKTKELWLFTMRFPYGTGEAFLENELPYLCERFRQVRLFPMFKVEGRRDIPANAVVEDLIQQPYAVAGPVHIIRKIGTWRRVVREMRGSCPNKDIWRKQWPELRSKLRQSLLRADVLRQRMSQGYDPGNVVLYSYWTYDWATVLGLLRMKDDRIHFITRMLGFDMYKFRSPDGWPAFRTFHLKQVDQVYIISQAGMDHMREHYPEFNDKYSLSFLATRDHGQAPWQRNDMLRVVSCSNLVPLKRVHLIAEALGKLDASVQWTHFGDGEERAHIKEIVAALPEHVKVELKGNTPNAQVIAWYQQNPVDVFMHVSSTEGGAPVALQEAASFGIPLIGADSGGVREIVTEHTGILLPHEIKVEELARTLDGLPSSPWYSVEKRQQVRAFWAEHFKADVVYGRFAQQLAER